MLNHVFEQIANDLHMADKIFSGKADSNSIENIIESFDNSHRLTIEDAVLILKFAEGTQYQRMMDAANSVTRNIMVTGLDLSHLSKDG